MDGVNDSRGANMPPPKTRLPSINEFLLDINTKLSFLDRFRLLRTHLFDSMVSLNWPNFTQHTSGHGVTATLDNIVNYAVQLK